jgi:AcrR family transcriptional regulator
MSQNKKILIYQAALSLVDENLDLSRIKVADIAQRANIGKSTVYEYFQSKEHVIGEALLYMFKQGIGACQAVIHQNKGFKEAYTLLLKNLSQVMGRNRNCFDLMTMEKGNWEFRTTIAKIMFQEHQETQRTFFQLLEELVDMSVTEGLIKQKPSRYEWQAAVFCSMTYIFVQKKMQQDFIDIPDDEVLEKAYQAYVKLLA